MSSRPIVAIAALGLLLLSAAGGVAQAEDSAGQALFLEQRCHGCHAVPNAGIAKAGDDTVSAPRLEALGDRYKRKTMKRWLERKKNAEGYTHLQYFKGTDEELQVLVDWLIEQ